MTFSSQHNKTHDSFTSNAKAIPLRHNVKQNYIENFIIFTLHQVQSVQSLHSFISATYIPRFLLQRTRGVEISGIPFDHKLYKKDKRDL